MDACGSPKTNVEKHKPRKLLFARLATYSRGGGVCNHGIVAESNVED